MFEDTQIKYLKGVGEKRAQLFSKLGVTNVGALLSFYPRAYENWSDTVNIAQAPAGEKCVVSADVLYDMTQHYTRSGMNWYDTQVSDGTGLMRVVIFNNKYAAAKLRSGEHFLFYGKVEYDAFGRSMNSPQFQTPETAQSIVPVYHTTAGLSSASISRCVKQALSAYSSAADDEPLSDSIIEKYGLMSHGDAIRNIHFPENEEMLAAARQRLIFDELLMLSLGMMMFSGVKTEDTGIIIKKDFSEEFEKLLPFDLTGAQKAACADVVSDMSSGKRMARLIQGDVGCGKTAVAASAVYTAAKNGYCSALMAPTEILAKQHFETFGKFFEGTGLKTMLLTGSMSASEKKEVRLALKNGGADLVIGTHALLTQDTEIKDLGLVITDEQHRFGVEQRSMLSGKGNGTHMLVMSATPIPRTLALSLYGDLDFTVIDEMPAGRVPVKTYLIDSGKRQRAYGYIKKFLDDGKQAYIICPLVDDDDDETQLRSVKEYAKNISQGEFAGYTTGVMYGSMPAKAKEKTAEDFASGKIQLLVSTTVVEVGVDVPDAVIIMIENSERFGLSTLHQLRGRVGRSSYQSTCILVSDNGSEKTQQRLKVMCSTTDGFKIASEDLALRGPGDFFGSRQHGLPELKLADLMQDTKVLSDTGNEAKEIYRQDPGLSMKEHEKLAEAVHTLFEHTQM